MTVSLIRLEQLHKTDNPNDGLTGTQVEGIEASAVDHQDFLTGVLSQFKRIIHGPDSGNWFDDVEDIFGGDASLKALYERATLEAKYVLALRENLNDITVAAAAKATGTITCVSKAELVDGEKFVIDDGTRVVTFWIDQTGGYTPIGGYDATNVRLNVSGCTDADSVVDVVVAAINVATIDITASEGTSPIVNLLHDSNGPYNYTITETVDDADFAVTGMTGGGGGNVAVLTGSVKPDKNIAIAATKLGAATAQLAGRIGTNSLTEVAGSNALRPKNIVYVFNGDTGDPIISGGYRVYGLLQVGSGATDGNAFGNTGSADQGQISFVRANATYDDLEACLAVDIAAQKIIYAFGWRESLKDMPEEFFRGDIESADPQAGVTVSLDSAYDGGYYMTVDGTDVDIRLANTKSWVFRAGTGSAIMTITRNDSGGDVVQIDADILDINNVNDVDVLGGAKFDTGGTTINVGVTAGHVDATGLDVEATAGDLTLQASADINFATSRETAIQLDDATTGKISTLFSQSFASVAAAIKYAGEHGGVDMTLKVSVLGSNYAQGDNIPAAIQNITANPIDMNSISTVTQLVFLNGRLLQGGNGTTKNDCYVGTTAADGDLKVDFAKGVKSGDVIISAVLKQ